MTITSPKLCDYCNRPMRYRYPGNDPECGPARLSCGFQWCDQARESIEWAKRYSLTTATMDQIHAEALEENSIADMYPDNLCENCGADTNGAGPFCSSVCGHEAWAGKCDTNKET